MKNDEVKTAGNRQIVLLIVCITVGVLGIHRFMMGRTLSGLLMLCTLGGFGFWVIYDLIQIAQGNLRDDIRQMSILLLPIVFAAATACTTRMDEREREARAQYLAAEKAGDAIIRLDAVDALILAIASKDRLSQEDEEEMKSLTAERQMLAKKVNEARAARVDSIRIENEKLRARLHDM